MVVDVGKKNPTHRLKVWLNERAIKSVWYMDRRRGCLRTYDVYDDGSDSVPTIGAPYIAPEWDAPIGGVLSKELRGRIRVQKLDPWPNGKWRLGWRRRKRLAL